MRPFSLLKVASAVAGGLAITFLVMNRPLTAPLPNTVHIADMTWVEVRTALEQGFTTVIVPSGGIEQNGPHMILGKHDYIVRHAAERIAGELGKTLVAPVISYVPEGGYDPPTGHMRFPGTIGVTEAGLCRHRRGHCAQPEGRRISHHRVHCRSRRQPGAAGRDHRAAQRRMGGQRRPRHSRRCVLRRRRADRAPAEAGRNAAPRSASTRASSTRRS